MELNEERHVLFLRQAMEEADRALARGDEPYGAVITAPDGTILACAGNEENTRCDPTAHAEILAIRRAAAKAGHKSLRGCSLYGNYRPCPMCAAALLMTGIERWYIGSRFSGPEALFLQTAEKIHAHPVFIREAMADEECTRQVNFGRKALSEAITGYQSGHKNGII